MKKDQLKRVHIKIKGKRHEKESKTIILKLARKFKLTGFVSGREGVVEVIAEGEKVNLFEFLKNYTSINMKSKIKEILFYFKEAENKFTGFSLN
ncbi:hypothetical protein A2716_04780 [candidate division WWE3 bacterium RIFCSPHIGHO2_01_FULL_40_23]|uniref:Acylphosphatase-like domain-containing protein n=1 Tax=candidate division WWE3 bacterium RIFCSPLOWO2_01_FULL_41_18 TaxID=1802625 RepID=A0A1F4VDD6_UNCKA|nr:MAG: hypothetical protein A2716_04780 [candidate division WWE3 bacterium RIFCSPHIGHO2_01_FULL_40_23]OGC55185.1 MAG: hypothetical protein A3A78_04390 [candidate division WWE3 bacterium RIFCSPLOWO2_01_FULL_41_18]